MSYLYRNFDEYGRINAKEALLDAGEYFNNNATFISAKDVIVTMTR